MMENVSSGAFMEELYSFYSDNQIWMLSIVLVSVYLFLCCALARPPKA